ncbi:MAG: hypothetical protein U0905_22320 [Pirellulales bacterium]
MRKIQSTAGLQQRITKRLGIESATVGSPEIMVIRINHSQSSLEGCIELPGDMFATSRSV